MHEAIIALGRLTFIFGRVNRSTYHDDGTTPESDTDHTVMLGLVACAFAERKFPELDVGLIAQYALVHDLVEAYSGDTCTLWELSEEAKNEKHDRERAAYDIIAKEFSSVLPWLPNRISEYESRKTPEARYVKAIDKLLPKIAHILNGLVTFHQQGMTRDQLIMRYNTQLIEMKDYAADFTQLFELREDLVDEVLNHDNWTL